MRNLLFWGLFPFLAPQALYVRRTAPRFAAAQGPRTGSVGAGHEFRLLAIGDSIIAGVGAGRLENALVGTTAAALSEALGATISWRAVGGVGFKTRAVTAQLLPQVPDQAADFIVLSVGVNDITGLTTLPAWRQDLRALLRHLGTHSPAASIAIVGVPPLGSFPLLPQPLKAIAGMRARSFDLAAQRVIAEMDNSIHVPVKFESRPDRFAADGYHPSEDSYREYGIQVAEQLVARI